MYKGSLKNFFLAKTTHRFPKVMTLAVSSVVLVAMVNIDASASAFGGRDSNSVRSGVVLTLASESNNSQFSGLVKRWSTITSISPTTLPTVTTVVAGGGDAGSGSGSSSGSSGGTGPSGGTGSGGTGGGTGGGGGTTTTTTTTPPPTTTTTTPSIPAVSGGLITAGASRSECLEPNFDDTGLASLQAAVTSFDNLTNSNVTCLLAYLNGAPTWSDWVNPWVATPGYGYTAWVAQAPQTRQLVIQVDLIPVSLENVNNPLSWEQSCAAGNFDTYATELANNLVAAGLQNSVIRLGAEMNGAWEADYVGNTTQEQNLWATCFANEVTSFRQAPGANFLIDWNPNAFNQDIPYANFYPGNAYVDILGLDQYDASGLTSGPFTFAQMATEPDGLNTFEAFAAAQGKPMSFPEWGLYNSPGDDPGFVDGIGSAVAHGNFAFEAYYDVGNDNTMALSSGSTPQSLTEFEKWFGN